MNVRADVNAVYRLPFHRVTLMVSFAFALVGMSLARTVDSPCHAGEALSEPIQNLAATAPVRTVTSESYVYEPRIRTSGDSAACDLLTTRFQGLVLILK